MGKILKKPNWTVLNRRRKLSKIFHQPAKFLTVDGHRQEQYNCRLISEICKKKECSRGTTLYFSFRFPHLQATRIQIVFALIQTADSFTDSGFTVEFPDFEKW
jgi:hypothetical protein